MIGDMAVAAVIVAAVVIFVGIFVGVLFIRWESRRERRQRRRELDELAVRTRLAPIGNVDRFPERRR